MYTLIVSFCSCIVGKFYLKHFYYIVKSIKFVGFLARLAFEPFPLLIALLPQFVALSPNIQHSHVCGVYVILFILATKCEYMCVIYSSETSIQ